MPIVVPVVVVVIVVVAAEHPQKPSFQLTETRTDRGIEREKEEDPRYKREVRDWTNAFYNGTIYIGEFISIRFNTEPSDCARLDRHGISWPAEVTRKKYMYNLLF